MFALERLQRSCRSNGSYLSHRHRFRFRRSSSLSPVTPCSARCCCLSSFVYRHSLAANPCDGIPFTPVLQAAGGPCASNCCAIVPLFAVPRAARLFSPRILLFRALPPVAGDATHMARRPVLSRSAVTAAVAVGAAAPWPGLAPPGLFSARPWRIRRWPLPTALPVALRRRRGAVALLALLARRRAWRWLSAAQQRWGRWLLGPASLPLASS